MVGDDELASTSEETYDDEPQTSLNDDMGRSVNHHTSQWQTLESLSRAEVHSEQFSQESVQK